MKICPNCGEKRLDGAVDCPRCGELLIPVKKEIPQEEKSSIMKICPNCEKTYPNETVQCPLCDAVLEYVYEPEKTNFFKRNFWIAFWCTLLLLVIYGAVISFIKGIIAVCKKEKGAEGWFIGSITAAAAFFLIVGGCIFIYFN